MIYVDQLFVMEAHHARAKFVGSRNGHRWCHMWCDVGYVEQLHEMAAKIGMRREWFQNKPGFPHYDLVPSRRTLALSNGAVEKPLIEWMREQRKQVRELI